MTSESSRDYSRTEYVFGKDALEMMQKATFLVIGCAGCGVEVAKNIFLTGCSVSLYDPSLITSLDISSNPFANLQCIGQRRDVIAEKAMVELNPQKQVLQIDLTDIKQLLQYEAVIFTENVCQFTVYEISDFCHERGIPFVISQVIGLAGRLFCDFGEKFTVLDTNGELVNDITISSVMIDVVNSKPMVIVEISEGAAYPGDSLVYIKDIRLRAMKSEAENEDLSRDLSDCINNTQYRTREISVRMFEILLPDNSKLSAKLIKAKEDGYDVSYLRGGYSLLIKEPCECSFESFSQESENPLFCDDLIDFVKIERRPLLHSLFKLVDQGGCLPTVPYDEKQTAAFLANLPKEFSADPESAKLASIFAGASMSQLSPIASVMGGWGAQEALKSVSGKFTPVREFYYYDCFELIKQIPQDAKLCNSRYDGQISALGIRAENAIESKSLFLVGAGALGCELIKIFALMGACTAENAVLSVTDLDSIENSNLSREFLFRESDSGKMKSAVAAARAVEMNPQLNVSAMTHRIGRSNPLAADFWSRQDVVCNALDNVETRRFVDGKCVEFAKPLLESGTLGSKAYTQIVVPRLTQIYSASQDSQSSQQPACTIHNFPNTITHCIVYVMSEFNGLFEKAPADLITLYECRKDEDFKAFCEQIEADQTSMKERVVALCTYCALSVETPKQAAVLILALFKRYFIEVPGTLLKQFPLDTTNKDGTPFWVAEKRPPRPLEFNFNDPAHRDFAICGTVLLGEVFGLKISKQEAENAVFEALREIGNDVQKISFPQEEVLGQQIDDLKTPLQDFMKANLKYIPKAEPHCVLFEKDNPDNCHIEFVSGFSNLRAQNYDIPNVDAHQIRRISGNIIPAMITTTASICGHVGIEFYKLCLGFADIEDYKQVFLNFALPLLQFSENAPCTREKVGSKTLTVWDQFEMSGDPTIGDAIDYVREKLGIELDSIMIGSRALFMGFMDPPAKKSKHIRQIIRDGNTADSTIDADGDLLLIVLAEDDEIDLPNLKLLK